MKILYLGPPRERLILHICSLGDDLVQTEENVNVQTDFTKDIDMIVSYGYRHILKPDLIDRFPNRIVNLHISLLPWNRGADPIVWSFLEDSPKGVSIHYIDRGIDAGAILAQEELHFANSETLSGSYGKLSLLVENLFVRSWADIKAGKMQARPQAGTGSFHQATDLQPYLSLLTRGWDTPVIDLIGKAVISKQEVSNVK